MSGRLGGGLRIGVAIGSDSADAVIRVGRVVRRESVQFALAPDSDNPAAAITAALQALANRLEASLGRSLDDLRVDVALLPPLSDVRLVQLPPIRLSEAEAVIRRDAARHFVGGSGARVVAVTAADGQLFAAAAPVALVEAVRSAIAACGWETGAIAPASAAWLAAAQDRRAGRRRAGASVVVAAVGDAAHVFRTENGVVTVTRRVPAAWLEEVVAAAGAAPGRATVFAERDERQPVTRALAAAGWVIEDSGDLLSAEEAAALHAAHAKLELIPPTLTAERRARVRSRGLRLAAAAIILLAATAGVELWDAQRELEAVVGRRAEIRANVAPLLISRDSLQRLSERIAQVRAVEAGSPRWTQALFELSMLLPLESHVTSLRMHGDTLEVEATGGRAGEALQALRKAGSLTDVQLLGTVERDLQDGATTLERFRFAARLPRPKPPVEQRVAVPSGRSAGSGVAADVGRRTP